MHIVDRGTGVPIVLVPGVQGRWEYVRPAVDALARSFRVITFSLCGERGSPPSKSAAGIDRFADQIEAALDARGIQRAVVCGISFGGLAALRFAARDPRRTAALVLVSTPGPAMRLKRRHQLYARFPRLFGPLFIIETPRRVRREMAAALPGAGARARFAWGQVRAFLGAGVSFQRLADRATTIGTFDVLGDCRAVTAPTLVVAGEPALDYVVPPSGTSQYVAAIRGARAVTLERTGHLGSITRPDLFAEVLREFVETAVDGTGRPLHGRNEHDAA
jgi:pimeloyl-ACP methyl ester carboxylesterase